MTPEHDASNVDAGSVKALTITFDRPMRHMAVVELPGLVSPAFTGRPVYDATSRVLTVPCRLEPGTAYGLQLNSPENMVMTDERGTPLPPVVYRFRTKK
jgi:hypothetical protein